MPEFVANMIQVHPFRVRDGRVEHLILQRSRAETYGPGAWQVITGTIDHGERSADAALRELREETRLVPLAWFALPGVATFYFEPTDQVIISPMFACRLSPADEPLLSEEHMDFVWLAADEACRRLVYPTHLQGVRELEAYLGASHG